MSSPLHVLILEDREPDALLIADALREHGVDFVWHRVDTETDFREALKGGVDIVLADYYLSGFTALDALEWLRADGHDVPLIIVTGYLGDEAAAECIRKGAADYLLKDRLGRLGAAVRGALDELALRREKQAALAALEARERRFRSVFEQSPIGLAILDRRTGIVEANNAFERITGASLDRIRGCEASRLIQPDERHLFARAWERVENGDVSPPDTFTVRFADASGSGRWASARLSRIGSAGCDKDYALLALEDVTARVLAERSAGRRAAVLHAIGNAADRFLREEDWDTSLHEYLSSIVEAAGLDGGLIVFFSKDRELEVAYRLRVRDIGPVTLDDVVRHLPQRLPPTSSLHAPQTLTLSRDPASLASGMPQSLQVVLAPIPVHQMCWGYLVFVAARSAAEWSPDELAAYQAAAELLGDAITDRQASEALRASERHARLLLDTALDAVISTDGDGLIRAWNRRATMMFGYTEDEVVGKPVLSVIAPGDRYAEWREGGVRAIKSGETVLPRRFETTARDRNNREFPVEVAVSSAVENNGVYLCLYVRDLTDRERTQEALAHAREEEDRIARRIQETLLFGNPVISKPTLSLALRAKAGQSISGDFVWTYAHSDDVVDVVLGDVMGKGLGAALFGAVTKNALYEAVMELREHLAPFERLPEPAEILALFNARAYPELLALESFLTLAYARFDWRNRVCQIVDCGHTRTAHLSRRLRTCSFLQGESPPLGIYERLQLKPIFRSFETGDRFVLYSDGVIDAENMQMDLFGEARLKRLLLACLDEDLAKAADRAIAAVEEFCSPGLPKDDLTCVVVAVGPLSREAPVRSWAKEFAGGLEELLQIRSAVEEFCNGLAPALRAKAASKLPLAVHEAASRIVAASRRDQVPVSVQILGEVYEDRVEMRVYGGARSLFALSDAASSAEPDESNLWLSVIQESVSEAQYGPDLAGRECLTLVVKA